MSGVPTKFIIDSNGIIRYKIIGFDEEVPKENEVTELSEMIDNVEELPTGFTMEFQPL